MFPLRNGPNTKHGCISVLCLLCFSALEIKKYKWSDLKSNTYLKSNYAAGHALHKRKSYSARKRLREDTQCVVQRWSTQSARGLGRLSPPETAPGTTAAAIRPWLSFWDPGLEGRLLLHKPTVTFSYFPLGKLQSESVTFPKIHQLLLITYWRLLKLRQKASHMPSVFSVGEKK